MSHIDSGSLAEPYMCVAILQKVMNIVQNKKNVSLLNVYFYFILFLLSLIYLLISFILLNINFSLMKIQFGI